MLKSGNNESWFKKKLNQIVKLNLFRNKKMGGSSSTPATPAAPASTKKCDDNSCSIEKKVEEKPKCKACCACPETKKIRDAW